LSYRAEIPSMFTAVTVLVFQHLISAKPLLPRKNQMSKVIARPTALSEQVVADLERRIRTGKILPGAKLPSERELCEEFGVSRLVIREAVARLKGDGYIETRQGAGASVPAKPGRLSFRIPVDARLSSKNLRFIMELRLAVEVVAAQLAAARRTDADLAAMEASLREMHEAVTQGLDGSQADDEFHQAVAGGSKNPHLTRLIDFLRYQFGATRRATWNAKSHRTGETLLANKQHSRLFDAIKAQHVGLSGEIATEHLISSAKRLGLGELEPYPLQRDLKVRRRRAD
jgi:GntR family transcriptional regulator, transcriptional repressor for pyruvate dehydrogenase complex